MSQYLSRIVAAHRAGAARDERDVDELIERAMDAPPPVPFATRLAEAAGEGLAVIAELKRRSPSRGDLAPDLDPAAAAAAYAAGGAACLSVLTDREFFGGSPEDLVEAKEASGLPVLRKDFTVSRADVCDARVMGADAVLLIAAALGHEELAELGELAKHLGLDALVEIHDPAELPRALAIGSGLVGVNQRDLSNFVVEPSRAAALAASIPSDVVAVAESGVRDAADAARLAAAGYQAVLVGEALVAADDKASAVAALRGHPVAPRSAQTRLAAGGAVRGTVSQ